MQDRYHPRRPKSKSLDSLYLLPIGGTAMAPLAGMLRDIGHRVQGVDSQLYPPMSTLLEELEIPVRIGFDAEKIPDDIDRVIIGNAVPRSNPEVAAVLARGLPFLSQPEAVAHYVLATGLDSIVVAGTHGKTTTSALLSWLLEDVGLDPSYLVGGLPRWSGRAFRRGAGRHIVIEGDEYNTAFFDRGPKFLHYRPQLFLLGPVEFDHADIYRDLEAVMVAFRAGVAQVPRHGTVVVNGWSREARAACRDTAAQLVVVGNAADSDLRLAAYEAGVEGSVCSLEWQGRSLEMALPLYGEHNAQNATMAMAAALTLGVGEDDAVAALGRFPGVARRLEVIGEAAGIIVVDDFAHHPTALGVTAAAARQRWPGRRLVIAFEPRSLTAARRSFHDAYLEALAKADVVLVAPPFHRSRLDAGAVLDRSELADALAEREVPSVMPGDDEDPVSSLAPLLEPGDVVIACSSGSFDGFHTRLLERLTEH